MTSQDKEFRRGPQFSAQITATPEQYAALKEWSASVPTLYFLDICVVNATKLSDAQLVQAPRKAQLAAHLHSLDRPQHAFSYLCALIEKVSDSRGLLSDAELRAQILGDLAAMRGFFKHAKVLEPDDFAIDYLEELRAKPAELARPNYLSFLQVLNNHLVLRNPVSPALRFQKAKEIVKEADELSISKQHPLVVLALACLYGNAAAKRVLKFRADVDQFNAENALADVMAIPRLTERRLQIEEDGRRGGKYLRSDFITDDDGLTNVLRCFEPIAVRVRENKNGADIEHEIRVNLDELLTDLKTHVQPTRGTQDDLQTEQSPSEFERLLRLLSP
jgi:hypothetical protein